MCTCRTHAASGRRTPSLLVLSLALVAAGYALVNRPQATSPIDGVSSRAAHVLNADTPQLANIDDHADEDELAAVHAGPRPEALDRMHVRLALPESNRPRSSSN